MVGVPGEGERHRTTLVPATEHDRPVTGTVEFRVEQSAARSVASGAAVRRRAGAPQPRRAPGPRSLSAGRGGAALPALGGDFLSAALALLCREEPLSRVEIGDHADVVAEVADALAAVADRLAQDLALDDENGPGGLGPDATGPSSAELARARDALQSGSARARRGAAVLWARHLESLRDRVEQARPASITG